jgi:hypothetical protein
MDYNIIQVQGAGRGDGVAQEHEYGWNSES